MSKPIIDRRRPRESGHGRLQTMASPGAGTVEVRDGQGGSIRVSRGDLPGLVQMLVGHWMYLDREARR